MSTRSGKNFAAYGLNFKRVNATADGAQTIVEGVTGKKIVVLGYTLNATAAGTIVLEDKEVRASFKFAESGGAVYSGGPECPAFECAAGADLKVNNGAGVDTLGHITYILV